MKKPIYIIAILIFIFQAKSSFGQFVDKNEASLIANKWIQIVIDKYGNWGKSKSASALAMHDFIYKNRLIGYYCQAEPQGFIVVSLRKELEPVKACSEDGFFDPNEEQGLTLLLKERMSSMIDFIELNYGSIETANASDVASLIDIAYPSAWDSIADYAPGTYFKDTIPSDNYIQGQVLLTTSWHQNPPYNNLCPDLVCANTSNGCALVGCVATAAAQIMRYWAYPPTYSGGTALYDWRNMADQVYISSPQVQQDAVAVLCANIGALVGMQYGCVASSIPTSAMSDVYYYDYFYAQCGRIDRNNYPNWADWWTQIQLQLNANRPIHYRVTDHSIVCDGWRTSTGVPQYHMNYGNSNFYTAWYTIDALPLGGIDEEYMIINILPITSLQGLLDGVFPRNPAFPVRYVDINASGYNGVFDPGQYLLFLKGTTIKGTGNDLGVRFYGGSGLVSILCTDGKYDEGIKVENGGMKLRNNGMVYVH